jgi:protein transport protein SEC61 subunit gamma-like protein
MLNLVERIKRTVRESRRVLLVSSKPDPAEFKLSAKITGLGMLVIGIIGFAIFMVFAYLGPAVGGI